MVQTSMRRVIFWGGYAIFVVVALIANWSEQMLQFDGPVGIARAGLIMAWLAFVAYSIYCIPRESLWESAQKILGLFWGRQVTIDLYISVFLSIALVWLVTESVLAAILWSLAFIPFANLAILLFLILNLNKIAAAFGVA